MRRFDKLRHQLLRFLDQARELDASHGPHYKNRFDMQLFRCQSRYLEPCVNEAISTLETIVAKQSTPELSADLTLHLTEKLLDQITAISRVLRADKITDETTEPPLSTLYDMLCQHQEWEKRLILLVKEKQEILRSATNQNKANNILAAARDRLIRCQKSKQAIENSIKYREK